MTDYTTKLDGVFENTPRGEKIRILQQYLLVTAGYEDSECVVGDLRKRVSDLLDVHKINLSKNYYSERELENISQKLETPGDPLIDPEIATLVFRGIAVTMAMGDYHKLVSD
jgi:hypothetical protein